MKKTILFFLTFIGLQVSGQNHFVGIKGGLNLTNVIASNFTSNIDKRTGFLGGLTYDFIFKRHFSVSADIIYNQRGFTNDIIFTDEFGNLTGKKATIKFDYDYLSIPVKTGFNYGKTVYGFIDIGLTPSFLVAAKTMIPNVDLDGNVTGTETFDVKSRVTKFDIGGLLEIGGGYKFNNRYYLFTSFSYQQSFTTITNSDYFPSSKIRHYGISINCGLKCALTKE